MKIISAADAGVASSVINMLVYGIPGCGKTTFVSTAQDDPRTSPLLMLDFEGGIASISDRKDIDVVEIRTPRDFEEVYKYLLTVDCKYRSVGVDSLTEIHQMHILSLAKTKDFPELADYNKAIVAMRKLVRQLRDLPSAVFFTAHAQITEASEVSKVKNIGPGMIGKFAAEVPGLVDAVIYMEIEGGNNDKKPTRVISCKPVQGRISRLRIPQSVADKMPERIENPTITKLLDALGIRDIVGDRH